jgi:hypothetical protein
VGILSSIGCEFGLAAAEYIILDTKYIIVIEPYII